MPAADHRPDGHTPRAQRDIARLRRARSLAYSAGSDAMATALGQIRTAFDEAAAINAFKLRVERWLRIGPGHPAVRARFGARAALLSGHGLEAAIIVVERWWRDERRAFAIANALGCATRLSLDVLRELRLILRLMRRKRMTAEFQVLLCALREAPWATAAE